MTVSLEIEDRGWDMLPEIEHLASKAVATALKHAGRDDGGDVSMLFTGDEEIARINGAWRGKASPTNVLSFPAAAIALPEGRDKPLGDIVLAFGTVSREAGTQGKTLKHHATHLIVHGVLHLLGYDHMTPAEAENMERLEARILQELGVPDPYE